MAAPLLLRTRLLFEGALGSVSRVGARHPAEVQKQYRRRDAPRVELLIANGS